MRHQFYMAQCFILLAIKLNYLRTYTHRWGSDKTRILHRYRNVSYIQSTSQNSLTLGVLQTLLTSMKFLYCSTWMKLDTTVWLIRARKFSSKEERKLKTEVKIFWEVIKRKTKKLKTTLYLKHGVLIFEGCHNKGPKICWLKQQKFIFSQSWSLEVQDQAGLFSLEISLLGLLLPVSSHRHLSICFSVS